MKVWLVTVVVLFGVVELFQWISDSNWLQQIALLPTPVLFAAGFGLAIASNAKKHLPWQTWPPVATVQLQSPASSAGRSMPNDPQTDAQMGDRS